MHDLDDKAQKTGTKMKYLVTMVILFAMLGATAFAVNSYKGAENMVGIKNSFKKGRLLFSPLSACYACFVSICRSFDSSTERVRA